MKIKVLRLGHRIERDKRLSTHVALAARAFGCSGIVYSGEKDSKLENSINNVVKKWGGKFSCEYVDSYMKYIRAWKKKGGKVAHLTVYGMPVQKVAPKLGNLRQPLLVAVGGEKVTPEVYQATDFNVSVTSQPHSEVAALAILLDRIFKGKELVKSFKGAKLRVVPQERGKKVLRK